MLFFALEFSPDFGKIENCNCYRTYMLNEYNLAMTSATLRLKYDIVMTFEINRCDKMCNVIDMHFQMSTRSLNTI